MHCSLWLRHALIFTFAVIAPGIAAAQANGELPPLVYLCPMVGDEDVLEEKPGSCPKCKMALKAARLEAKYSCPVHSTVEVKDAPGQCRFDGRPLSRVTMSVSWTCPGDSTPLLEPGLCRDGTPRRKVYEVRAHGDHNPRHGGQFFMAEDAWHHIEGTLQPDNVFRLFFYDNFTKPFAAQTFKGRAVTREEWDPVKKVAKDVDFVELKPGRDRSTLEAKVPRARIPAKITAKVQFSAARPPQRFDFVFSEYSKDPGDPGSTAGAINKPVGRTTSPSTVARPVPASPTLGRGSSPVGSASSATLDPQLDSPLQQTIVITPPPPPIPELDDRILPQSTPELLAELTKRTDQVRELLEGGNLSDVWRPAMGTKTVALALDTRTSTLPTDRRVLASAAVVRVVAAAWELDAYGDTGNRRRIASAFSNLESAVTDLKAAYGIPQP